MSLPVLLIVDDDEAFLYAAGKDLGARGFEVVLASNYFDALDELDQPDRTIDALLTDIVLNRGNGFALARIARMHRPNLKTVYITAHDDVPTIEAVGPILRKGIAADDIAEVLRDELESAAKGAGESDRPSP